MDLKEPHPAPKISQTVDQIKKYIPLYTFSHSGKSIFFVIHFLSPTLVFHLWSWLSWLVKTFKFRGFTGLSKPDEKIGYNE